MTKASKLPSDIHPLIQRVCGHLPKGLGCSMPACGYQDLSSRVVRLSVLSGIMRHELNLELPHTSDFCKLTCANSHQVPGLPGIPCFALPWLPLSHLLKYIHGNENDLHGILPCTPSKFVGVISETFILSP